MSIKQLTVYNVNFGDCIDLELDNGKNLLIDCGSDNLSDSKKEEIKNMIVENYTKVDGELSFNVVVTHFHNDHYNILPLFPEDSISELYVPDFFYKDEIRLEIYLLLIYSIKTPKSIYSTALSLLSLIPNLIICNDNRKKTILKKRCKVNFVKKDSRFDEFEVLWPDPENEKIKQILSKVIEDIENKISNIQPLPTNKNIISQVNDWAERYESLINNIKNETNQDRFINSQRMLSVSNEIESIIDEINELKSQLESEDSHENPIDNHFLLTKSTKKQIGQIQNKVSLVFHNIQEGPKCLFLGDIYKSQYNNYISNIVEKISYTYIKVSHHGTKMHFTKKLPQCKAFIISNGNYASRKVCSNYHTDYPNVINICTDINNCHNINILSVHIKKGRIYTNKKICRYIKLSVNTTFCKLFKQDNYYTEYKIIINNDKNFTTVEKDDLLSLNRKKYIGIIYYYCDDIISFI